MAKFRIDSPTTSVSILRPATANQANLQIKRLTSDYDDPEAKGFFSYIEDETSLWQLERDVKRVDTLRDIIEWTAQRTKTNVNIAEYQLRRQEHRDCFTHDFHKPDKKGAFAAEIITVQDPNLGQVRFVKRFMRYAIAQQFVILHTDRDRVDDYVSDLGLDYEPVAGDSAYMAKRSRERIYLVNENNEDAVEEAFANALALYS